MYTYELDRDWQLRREELYWDKEYCPEVMAKQDGWLAVRSLPCDVHVPLIENGLIDDPLIADNYLHCKWIEEKSWWFRKTFDVDTEMFDSTVCELVLDGLDVKADIFLNGAHIGRHESAMYPFRRNVKDILKQTQNVLVVRVTSGLEYFSELELSKINDYISCEYKRDRGPRGDERRVLTRKAQYVYGWDWNPRIATCGITGHARLEGYKEIAIRHIRFNTKELICGAAKVRVEAEIENLYPVSTLDTDVSIEVYFGNSLLQSINRDVFLTSGVNYIDFDFIVEDPKLWWPNGMGEQNLYVVNVNVATENKASDCRQIKTGIRKVKLNTEPAGMGNRMFAFEINGVKTFCKGGNWVSPDSIYGRVTDAKYETLVREAKEANFNMLRFNGVNAYERDFFYDCCDKYGILVWQDFCFSCAAYPDELEWFRDEVRKEVEHQTKRLRNHPCIALWCGNNECQGLLLTYREKSYWNRDKKPVSPAGITIYNQIIPGIIKNNCHDIPYWNSSPYGGTDDIECNEYGDRHEYPFMSTDMEERISPQEYDKVACKFVSEFGCIGPPKRTSVQRYFGSEHICRESSVWKIHTNTFEKATIEAAIRKHYTDKKDLSLDEYLLYAGLFQGQMLSYAFESMRCSQNNFGALSWSFNEAFGEIGWSIIDYYLNRKISYYFVKRALAHKKLALREQNGVISVFFMNDTSEAIETELECGYVSFDGRKEDIFIKKIHVKQFEKAIVAVQFKAGKHDVIKGCYYAKANDEDVLPAILRATDFKKLRVSRPNVTVNELMREKDKIIFNVTSDRYVHGVHFRLEDGLLLSDKYFDLLPDETRRISVVRPNGEITIEKIKPYFVLPE